MFWKKKRPATYWNGNGLYTKDEGILVASVVKGHTDATNLEVWRAAVKEDPEDDHLRFTHNFFQTEFHARQWAERNFEVPR